MKKICACCITVLILAALLTSCFSQETTVTMIDSAKSLSVGKTYTLQYTLTPQNSNEKLTWTSSDDEIATVENGKVTALKPGGTQIKVTTAGGKSAVCNLTVKPIDITKIEINPSSVTIKKGSSEVLSAKIYPSAAANAEVKWRSSNASVATVTDDGMVSAKGAGTAVITATADNGKSGTAVINVETKKTKPTTSPAKIIIMRDLPDNPNNYRWIFSNSDTEYLTHSDVDGLTRDQAQWAINELCARHGYIFKRQYWNDVFSSYPKTTSSLNEAVSYFNATEKHNYNLLASHRDKVSR